MCRMAWLPQRVSLRARFSSLRASRGLLMYLREGRAGFRARCSAGDVQRGREGQGAWEVQARRLCAHVHVCIMMEAACNRACMCVCSSVCSCVNVHMCLRALMCVWPLVHAVMAVT